MTGTSLDYSFHVNKAIVSFIQVREMGTGRQMIKDKVDELCNNHPL